MSELTDNSEIGLQLEKVSLALTLYIGIVFAIFSESGKTPVCKDLLISILRDIATFSLINFRKYVLQLSRPMLFLDFRSFRIW